MATLLETALMAVLANGAFAGPAPGYSDLLRLTQDSAPRLLEGEAGIAQAQGLRTQAGARPNPSLSAELENFARTGPSSGLPSAEGQGNTFSVTQPIEFWGKRDARIEAGDAAIATSQARMVQTRADYNYDLAIAYIGAEATEKREAFAAETLRLAEDDGRVARALVSAGKEAQFRQVQAQTAVAAARSALEASRSERERAFADLTALSGAQTPYTTIVVSLLSHADKYEPPVAPDPTKSPAFLTALAAQEEATRRIRVERTRPLPDVNVSLGVRTFAGTDAKALVGGITIPIPIFDTNSGNISASQAELKAASARLAAARNDADAQARAAVARARAALTRIAAAVEGEKAAEQAYRLTRTGYEGGKLSFIEVLNTSRALADARAATIDARVERLTAEAALARLQGGVPFGDHQ
jgi:cobalt-zinc-cadmium efflux system outer membrane protein